MQILVFDPQWIKWKAAQTKGVKGRISKENPRVLAKHIPLILGVPFSTFGLEAHLALKFCTSHFSQYSVLRTRYFNNDQLPIP